MKNKILCYLLPLFFALAVLPGCTRSKGETKEEEKKNENSTRVVLNKESLNNFKLEIAIAEIKAVSDNISAPAKILTNQDYEAYVGSFVQGRVQKVLVNPGDFVKRGQVLMYIEGIEIGTLKAEFLKSKAELEFKEANYNRQKTLLDQKVGSQRTLLEAKAEFDKALAEFTAADKKIHSIGLTDEEIQKSTNKESHTAGNLSIKSPLEGVIVERNVVIGQLVEPNTNAFRIVNTANLIVEADINEKDVQFINGRPDITFKASSYTEDMFRGKVNYISDVIDPNSRTIKVRATINNTSRKLKPQMFGELLLPINGGLKKLVVPTEAIVNDIQTNYLFVVLNDTTFEKRIVLTGQTYGKNIEIKDGLKEGEKIAIKGVFFLKSELMKSELESGE